ncbi:hypothetical protein VHEMI02512 [[Torrubiella] hemipterigena]|uniref:Uncharacterized protein n=1 Tax=[Torrubiella] hemipterigena TaxID=1531966 RepID=A0A0A1TAQ3_9HYPO|nr:hypothetical protein VHEMI02512 [[Torrubiella] hemipterigena]
MLANVALLFASAVAASPLAARTVPKHNDYSCKSSVHPNPVVLLHGLGATYYEDINFLEDYLQRNQFCTFTLTYGDYPNFPFVGGLKSVDESSQQIADFVRDVKNKTGAAKIDLVGHSEGAFQSIYTPKVKGIADIVERVVALAPPTHGTTFANLRKLADILSLNPLVNTVLETFGCQACVDLSTGGDAIKKLNDGKPIAQPGNKVTVITSKYDELVTPTTTSFIDEAGVNNIYVQDYCPYDPVGHIGEAYDTNVWNLILNALEDKTGRKFLCLAGSPGK